MTDKCDTKLELKFLAETGVFEGYASVFNVVDQVDDKIAAGAFKESLTAHHKSGRFPPLLWQHNTGVPIGAWREMREDSHGLYVKGELFVHDIAQAREAYKLLKENVVNGLSIGYRTRQAHREKKSGVRVLTKLDLLEVSLVTFPANEMARVSSVKNRDAAFQKSMEAAIADIKNDIAARRLRESLRKAAAEAYNHKEKK
jgi:HK97 family phage prohead protease